MTTTRPHIDFRPHPLESKPRLKLIATILLLVATVTLGTGLGAHVHRRQAHEHSHPGACSHADLPAHGHAGHESDHEPTSAPHNDSHCIICAQLHAPLLVTPWLPILLLTSDPVTVAPQLTAEFISQQRAQRINCRGPPASR